MQVRLVLTGIVVAAAALVGIALFTATIEGQREPAVAATETPTPIRGPVHTASVSGVDEAVRELDLIRPAKPKQAADFTVSLLSGDTMKLAGQRGKPVLINFWATWCGPCREEMPAMERLYNKHRARGFVLLAVSVDTNAELVKPFLQQHKLTFPVALDAKMELANAYGVRALPASFVIDRNGYLTALALGPRAWDNRAANTLVEGLLAQ